MPLVLPKILWSFFAYSIVNELLVIFLQSTKPLRASQAVHSYLVKYNLEKLEKDYGPYKKGDVWAKPDTKHAAELMKEVFENQNKSKEIGLKAKEDIMKFMNFTISGNEIKDRIKLILKG